MNDPSALLIVGSENPIKLQAVRAGAAILLGNIEVCGTRVESGVRAQPFGDEEMIAGNDLEFHDFVAFVVNPAGAQFGAVSERAQRRGSEIRRKPE